MSATTSSVVGVGTTLGILKHPILIESESMTISTDGRDESEEVVDTNRSLLESRLKMINLLRSIFKEDISKIPEFLEFEASVKAEYLAKKRMSGKKRTADSFTQTPFELIESLILHPARLLAQKGSEPSSLEQQVVSQVGSQVQPARVWDSHPRQAWMVSSTPVSTGVATVSTIAQQQPSHHQRQPLTATSSSSSQVDSYLQRFPVRTYSERESQIIHGLDEPVIMPPSIQSQLQHPQRIQQQVTSIPSLGSSSIQSQASYRGRPYYFQSQEEEELDFDVDLQRKNDNNNVNLPYGYHTSSRIRSGDTLPRHLQSRSGASSSHHSLVVEESASSDPDESSPSSSSAALHGSVCYKNIIITLRSDGSASDPENNHQGSHRDRDDDDDPRTPVNNSTACPIHSQRSHHH